MYFNSFCSQYIFTKKILGEKGDEGYVGLPGVSGPQGHKGDTGYPGRHGESGDFGLQGDIGLDGKPGKLNYLFIKITIFNTSRQSLRKEHIAI